MTFTKSDEQQLWVHCEALLTPFRRHQDCVLRISAGKILEILPYVEACRAAGRVLDREPGVLVVPGFVDLHVHGAGGRDAMEGTLDSLETISRTLSQYGTTSFLATTMSAPARDLCAALRGIAEHHDKVTGARLLGVHMEGPYLNPVRRGAHPAQHLKPAEVSEFRCFTEAANHHVRKITLAPEMDPGLEVTREAIRSGIRVSIGHSDATMEQAKAAIEAGARDATHTFNAMRPFHQREPGILGQILIDERVNAEVIADGFHVHPGALRLLLRVKAIESIILVSDGTSAVGMPDGDYRLGGSEISFRNGECRDADGNLAGSTLTLDRALRHLVQDMEIPLDEVLPAATATPARTIGAGDRKGVLAPGADADLVFLDGALEVMRTMVAGRIVFSKT